MSKEREELLVAAFNLMYREGDRVKVEMDDGKVRSVTVRQEAAIVGGMAVAWFGGISGAYSVERVEGIDECLK